jgi:hypothetical protein
LAITNEYPTKKPFAAVTTGALVTTVALPKLAVAVALTSILSLFPHADILVSLFLLFIIKQRCAYYSLFFYGYA